MASRKKKSAGLDRDTKIGIVAAIVAFFVFIALIGGFNLLTIKQPHPLGDNTTVVYLGEEAAPSSTPFPAESADTYYYGTDLKPEDLAAYFDATAQDGGDSGYEGFDGYHFVMKDNRRIGVMFYDDKVKVPSDIFSVDSTDKKHIFTIEERYYNHLKDSVSR